MTNFRSIIKSTFIFTQMLIVSLFVFSTAHAQTNNVDLSFNAALSKEAGAESFTIQPNGKILVFNGFQIVNGAIKNQIARLNADGSLDNSFDCAVCDFAIKSAVVQADGKIIVAGSFFSNVSSTSSARIIRLNADGSLDPTFNAPFTGSQFQINSSARVWAIQSDGKILVTVSSIFNGTVRYSLYQLTPDGAFDTKFIPVNFQAGQSQVETVNKVVLLPNEKILVSTFINSGTQISGNIRQYNSDGTPDLTFQSPVLSGDTANDSAYISDFDIQLNGSIVIAGKFSVVNAISRVNIARLLPAGNVDLDFNPANVFQNQEPATAVKVLPSGKILVFTGTPISVPSSSGNSKIYRLNSDGSLDNTFTLPSNLNRIISYGINAAGEILISGEFTENGSTNFRLAKLNTDGSVNSFLAVDFRIGGSAATLAIQTDEKIIVAGSFTQVNGVTRKNLARLNADGSLDPTFDAGTGFDSAVEKILIQPDGRILVGGSFTTYNGTTRKALARINADGTLDETFNAQIADGIVYSIALQTTGEIIIGGSFNTVSNQSRSGLARLNADGSLDESFNPMTGNAVIRRVLVQADGKIMIGGSFTGINGFARANLVRLNINGSLDNSFFVRNISPVTLVEIQADGKYLVMASDLIRLNMDGSTDFTFQTPSFQFPNVNNNGVFAILPQPDGSIIIGGSFVAVNGTPRLRIARLKPDGTIDAAFVPAGANNIVRAIVRQNDGKILIGGDFTSVANVTRLGIARLNVAPIRARFTPFDFDGDGKADVSVFRPSNGVWYLLNSQNGFSASQFGNSTDKIAPADYDNDGKADLAVFRDGIWYLQRSTDGFTGIQFGEAGDIPQPADFDNDGRAELAVFRPSTGIWFVYNLATSQTSAVQFGVNGDKPVVGDYDGDGKADVAVFRPSNGVWYLQRSTDGFIGIKFGETNDKPVPADYDGDGKTDLAVFRPSNGTWYLRQSQAGTSQVQSGISTDVPVPADYDGDGKADIAVFRNGTWFIQQSTAGFKAVQFGEAADKPTPSAFVF